jgi:uncharacterized membrane protein YoaK (UPF0700 family)
MAADKNLEVKIQTAVTAAVADPTVPAAPAAIPVIVGALTKLIPEILHATNNEPWYRSQVTWGSIVALVGGILALFGVAFPAEMQGQVVGFILSAVPVVMPIAGALYALYGRWRAKKPIGQ